MLWSRLLVFCLLVVSVRSIAVITNLTSLNWELSGCPILDVVGQGDCNAGYAYAVAATIQLAYCVHTSRVTVPLSAKQIIKCSSSFGNHGCEGGSAVNAFKYVNASEGLNPASYYLVDSMLPPCSALFPGALKISGFSYYEDVTEEFLIDLLFRIGPVIVGIDASLPSFQTFFGHGVYTDTNCKSGLLDLTHDVVLSGFGGGGGDIFGAVPYWEIVNSWGLQWGTGGRGKVARANNLCGIRTRVSFPQILQ